MISNDELAWMRQAQEDMMTDLCTIWHRTAVPDGMGGERESWNASGSAVCRVGATGRMPEERALAERLTNVIPYSITLPAGTAIEADDKIEVSSAFTPGLVRSFEVIGAVRGSIETALRCVCVEVK